MFEPIIEALQSTLSNQFLSGGLVLGLVGSLIALCRQLPANILAWLKRRLIVSVDITNDDPIFEWLSIWLAKHPYSKRARCLTAQSRRDDSGRVDKSASPDDQAEVVFTPAPGNHFFVYERRLVWLSRDRKDAQSDKTDEFFSRRQRETFQIRVLGRKQEVVRSLIEKARASALEVRHSRIEVLISSYDYWTRSDLRMPRPLSTVILPGNTAEDIAARIREFLDSQDWYTDRGIPYRLTFLFHGVPGSGKTSLITALAGEFRTDLYSLNLGDPELTDGRLNRLIANTKQGGFILLEDIDAAFTKREKGKDNESGVTFSGLLNALDGAASKEGSIVFMTTNHKEVLDPALIRPGRADVHIEFGYATREQARRLFQQFFPSAPSTQANRFAEIASRQVTMAQVQGILLQHKSSPEDALRSAILAVAA